ncbi:hypothetical protein K7X08_015875 [Anisodus acutangulus]|uniref:Uncharacterized protein n=1 Tax=Anisodus acutangulus TaxID=402998 RepID=A0A9Q1QXH5_9SOLA|nr:hypothetical protein K7X08_015875 [Anisodus acutangulus]
MFAKEPEEAVDVEATHSEDIGGHSIANDDGGHVGIGTYRDRAEPNGSQSVQLEQEKLKQRVDRMDECLNTLVTYVEGKKFRRSEKAKKKENERTLREKVQEPQLKFGIIHSPAVEVEKVDVPAAELEKVDVPAAEPDKVIPMPVAEVEKTPDIIVPAATDEKTSDVPAQVNGKIVSDAVEVNCEKLVEGVIAQINTSLDN